MTTRTLSTEPQELEFEPCPESHRIPWHKKEKAESPEWADNIQMMQELEADAA